MKRLLPIALLLLPCLAHAEEGLPNPDEQGALEALAREHLGAPAWGEMSTQVDGKRTKVRVFEFRKDRDYLAAQVDETSGRVVALYGNASPLTNDHLRQLATQLPELRSIQLGHWGEYKYRDLYQQADFSGAGFDAFGGTKLDTIIAGGTRFNDDGLRALLAVPQLKVLRLNHSAVTNEGLKALAEHPGLEEIMIADSYYGDVNNETVGIVVQIPNIKRIELGQSHVTYQGGLDQLKQKADQLESVKLASMAIFPEDLEKLKADLPNTKVEFTSPYGSMYEKYLDQRLSKWLPAETVQKLRAENLPSD